MPSQCRSRWIWSAYSWRERATSVSSKRSTKRPPFFSTNSQLNSAVRVLPMWMLPVGDGAKRTVTVMAAEVAKAGREGKPAPPGVALGPEPLRDAVQPRRSAALVYEQIAGDCRWEDRQPPGDRCSWDELAARAHPGDTSTDADSSEDEVGDGHAG